MSDFAGFVDADDYSGDPVYVDVTVTSEGELPVDDKGEEKKLPKDAVIYNVPGAARGTFAPRKETLFHRNGILAVRRAVRHAACIVQQQEGA